MTIPDNPVQQDTAVNVEVRHSTAPLSPDTQAVLDSLQRAVDKALDRKRRLGHYAVIWRDNAPVFIGEDAPTNAETGTTP